MEITHLRYFKKTAELEHITKAAQELHVAQPSLSRTISMLEDELKVKLFNRKGKSIELNEYGIIVLNHTNRILKELEAIHREIDDARENSVMNVTFSMNAASTLIPRLVRGFKEEHSDIRLHILIEAGEGDFHRSLFAGIGQALLLPIAVGGQELPGALTHFGSSQMVQVDVEMQDRAFLDDDLPLGGRVADQAGIFGERDLETVSLNSHHTGGFLYLQHTVYRRCFRIGKANVVIAAQ